MRGISLYHEVADSGAQPRTEVKKLSKQRERAADQAQIKKVSERVWKSLADVRQRPSGRPKYSSYKGENVRVRDNCQQINSLTYIAAMTCTSVRGANMMTRVLGNRSKRADLTSNHRCETYGELPTAPIMLNTCSFRRILIATARAAVVKVMLITRNSLSENISSKQSIY